MSITLHRILLVAVFAGGVALLRFMPFLIFGGKRPVPQLVLYLGRVLPFAMIGMLIVYCYKDVQSFFGLPEIIASAVTLGLQAWKRNMAVSIAGGTLCYMLLVQFIFL